MTAQPVTATEEQIAFYQTNGYVKFENVLTLEEVAAFRAALAEVTERPGEGYFFNKGAQYTQHVNVWTMGDAIRSFVFNPTLAGIARQLTRSSQVRIWHDQEIIKMPGDRPSSWHQDLTVWPMLEAGPLTCWLALVDVPVEMGCMSFLPGSQRWGRLATASLPRESMESLDGVRLLVPDDKRDQLQAATVPVTAGSCTFHNSLTLHYAGPNLTDQPREGFIINYLPDTIHYSGRKHVTTDSLELMPGAPLEGDLFPVLARVNG
jgi:ectoine hydroxylase-related dioxygenase (phytanoyl-CoA dioxygenase family)